MKHTLLAMVFFWVVPAFSGNEGAAGGDGVVIDGKTYLLDFVEAGIEESPYLNFELRKDLSFKNIRPRVARALLNLKDDAVVDGVTVKLVELGKHATATAMTILNIMEDYNWVTVVSELMPIDDEQSPLNVKTIQLAARQLYQIYISRDIWKTLSLENKVGLIFHESIYAGVQPSFEKQTNVSGVESYFYRQISAKARQLVGILFAERNAIPYQNGTSDIVYGAIKEAFGLEGYAVLKTSYLFDLNTGGFRTISFSPSIFLWSGLGYAALLGDVTAGALSVCSKTPWSTLHSADYIQVQNRTEQIYVKRSSFLGKDGKSFSYSLLGSTKQKFLYPYNRYVRSYESCMSQYGPYLDGTADLWKNNQSPIY